MNRFLLPLVLLFFWLGACQRVDVNSTPLSGEWRIRIESANPSESHAGTASLPIEGAFVFNERITEYGYDDGMSLPQGALLGRAYLSLDTVGTVSRNGAGIPFKRGPDADALEEVVAITTNDNQVTFEFAPKVSHSGLALSGILSRDTIRGKWTRTFERDNLDQGTFEMWRVPRTATTDSAIARSRRGARSWANEMKNVTTPEDTVLLPIPDPLTSEMRNH